ncbi:hypothetical protein NA57DRAFT_34014, partial [Rhizodiscina lignyota]
FYRVFLVELLTCGILTIFFLFYFNRLFSTLVSYGIRAYTWRAYRAYIDIQALQISFLGGRIFFKDLRYHAHNETIFVHGGFITWRYWLSRVREAEVHTAADTKKPTGRSTSRGTSNSQDSKDADSIEKGGSQTNKSLPCRIEIKVSGVEAFLYNRSPAYDFIIENVVRANGNVQTHFDDSEKPEVISPFTSSSSEEKESPLSDDAGPGHHAHAVYRKPPLPAFLRLFPIYVECNKAAAVLGNENTKSILTAKIDSASGVFEAGHAGPLDIYKQIFQFDVIHPVITIKPNPDFKEMQLATAVRLKDEALNGPPGDGKKSSKYLRRPKKAWHFLERLSPSFRKSFESVATRVAEKTKFRMTSVSPLLPGQERWIGLSRYLDDEKSDEHNEWDPIEYAKSSTIADISRIEFSFYWDVPGPVSSLSDDMAAGAPADPEDMNGTLPPEYGMNLHVHGGTVNYGPWADRQRINFQSIFFPPTYVDAVPSKRLGAGQYRVNSVFKLYMCVEEDVTLRIPFRENSKDWKWKGQAENMVSSHKSGKEKNGKAKSRRRFRHRDKTGAAPNLRPFAWIDIKVFKDTTINYNMDVYARKDGFRSFLIGDIRGTELSSSVNHGLLWRSGSFGLDCDLSYPLGWNALRKWRFDIASRDLEIFILRDHLFLLTDMILDWSSGPPPDYFTFVPFVYSLNLDFQNFKLYLNTNDANIINEPSSFEDNTFVILHGQRLFGDVRIPLDRYRPVKNEIPFNVKGLDFGLDTCMPPKTTMGTFAPYRKVATLEEVTLRGSHTAFTDTSIALTDTLVFDIHGSKFFLLMYGFLAHHFVRIKENYFGDDLHFRTLEEYQQMIVEGDALGEFEADKISNRGNDLDVILSIVVDDASAALPSNIYNASDNVTIDVPYATVDLRITNYYMDLMLDLSPLSVSLGNVTFDQDVPQNSTGQTQIFIDSVHLMGNRLFGLPPVEPAYVENWDVDVGDISGECLEDFLSILAKVAQASPVAFGDAENTLPVANPIVLHAITFLQLRTASIHLWLHVDEDAILVDLKPASVEFNDWANQLFSGRVNVIVPDIVVACVDRRSLSRHSGRSRQRQQVRTHAYLQTSVTLNVLQRKANFEHERSLQQAHLRLHDKRTQRAQFLILADKGHSASRQAEATALVEPPASVLPSLPAPVASEPSISGAGSEASSSASTFGRGRSAPSSVASSYFVPKRRLRRRASEGSLAESVVRSRTGLGRQKRDRSARQSSSHTTVAFSSPIAAPTYPMDNVDLDLSEVPDLPNKTGSTESGNGDTTLFFDDRTTDIFDESFEHTSIIVRVSSGLRCLVSPGALTCAINALTLVQPQKPEDVLDSYHADLPAFIARFVNHFDTGKDQFDTSFAPSTVTVRTVAHPAEHKTKNLLSVHVLLDKITVSLRELSNDGQNDVVTQLQITEILLWLVSRNSLSVNLSFRALQLGSSSRKVEYLTGLVDRTTMLVEQIVARSQKLQAQQTKRLKYLVYHLTVLGGDVADPAFLTRPTYAVRSSHGHVRQHDSWKIISRFRNILVSQSEEELRILSESMLSDSFTLSPNSEQTVIDTWDRWRAWDLSHVKDSIAFRIVYGPGQEPSDATPSKDQPLDLAIRSGNVAFVLDPGPKQSSFSMNDLAVAVSLVPPRAPSGLMLETEPSLKATLVQVVSKSTRLHLNWEIVELAETLCEVILQNEKYHAALLAENGSSPTPVLPKGNSKVQVVISMDTTVLSFDTINLRGQNVATDLKLSLVGEEKVSANSEQSMSALLVAKSATADLHSRSGHLLRLQSRDPSLVVAQNSSATGAKSSEEVKVVGTARTVLVHGREEILGLIEVVDAVLRDEASSLKQQIEMFNTFRSNNPCPAPPTPSRGKELPQITIALEMASYQIEFALLQSLSYSFAGKVGRLSVIPDLKQNFALKVDTDLDRHKHYLRSGENGESHTIAVVELPPVNAQLFITQNAQRLSLSASVIVEVIEIDASALHGLMETFRRPELSQTFDTIKADIGTVQRRYQQVFPESSLSPPSSPTVSSLAVEYQISCVLAGIQVTAAAHSLANHAAAKLSFGLGRSQVYVSNSDPMGSDALPLPNIQASVRRVFADLSVTDKAGERHCGNVSVSASVNCKVSVDERGFAKHDFDVVSQGLHVNLFAETASAVVDVVNHLQDRIKELDLSRERRYLQRLQRPKRQASMVAFKEARSEKDGDSNQSSMVFRSSISVKLLDIQIRWIVGNSVPILHGYEGEDLVFSIRTIDLATKSEEKARLAILDMQLAFMHMSALPSSARPWNSALLPEVVFNVAHRSGLADRSLWFHAAGKPLDIQLEPKFVLPASMIQRSITLAVEKFQTASSTWQSTPTSTGSPRKNPFGNKRLASLVVDADFAGATIHLQDRKVSQSQFGIGVLSTGRPHDKGKYGQFIDDSNITSASVRTPGLALKVEFKEAPESSLNVELRIDASSNTLYPTIVPLIIEISDTVKEVVRQSDTGSPKPPPKPPQKFLEDSEILTADPSAVLGKTQLNIGVRVCKQEFSLSCQPVARVAATTRFEDIYITVNSVRSSEQNHFFALAAVVENFQASVQHVYSRESTFSFDADSIVLSLINSKHLSGTAGISAILKISPMRTQVNARQLQDFLLFREIWFPQEIRQVPEEPPKPVETTAAPQEYLVQRYQQVSAAAAFPWTATIEIEEMSVDLDLGQAIGRSSFKITDLWASSKKSSNWEQNLCIGVGSIGVNSTGRMSGLVELDGIRVRTSITWPREEGGFRQAPRIQASVGFGRLRLKAAFDYQAFAISDITSFDFMMYNVKIDEGLGNDRLIAILNGDKVHAYFTATTASQVVALIQAFERLIQDNRTAYAQSLRDVEKFLRRKSSLSPSAMASKTLAAPKKESDALKAPISLHTDVVVTLQSLSVGAFPNSFTDSQVLLLEALDAQARFAVALEGGRIHSALGMTLGQLKVALASIPHSSGAGPLKPVGEIAIDDVVTTVTSSARGGTILRVPKVIAAMQTWQQPEDNRIDYIFKSSFEGKVDVGWNFSRISFIRGMWGTHTRTLAARLGKPLPESAVKITTGPPSSSGSSKSSGPLQSVTEDILGRSEHEDEAQQQEKITAVVNVPQSKYEYTALEPPIIETPQLRDMGEATPPLEWIGLHRDRLPNVTHQIVIVTLLEVAKEVEDAYGRILGRS